MSLQSVIQQCRTEFQGFRPAASDGAMARLRQFGGPPSEPLIVLYQDHDGSDQHLTNGCRSLPVRFMPIAKILEARDQMAPYENRQAKVGPIAWFWTDDSSNYADIYLDGPLADWVCVFDHEEPILTPAFRSVESFMLHLLAGTQSNSGESRFCDLPSRRCGYSKAAPDGTRAEQDWVLSEIFRKNWRDDPDEELSRRFAMCGICLIPFERTGEAIIFPGADDMWIPEAAVRLIEIRRWHGNVEQIQRLVCDGRPNGESAAMRLLERMNTNESRKAIARLQRKLKGHKLQAIEMRARVPLQPPRW